MKNTLWYDADNDKYFDPKLADVYYNTIIYPTLDLQFDSPAQFETWYDNMEKLNRGK